MAHCLIKENSHISIKRKSASGINKEIAVGELVAPNTAGSAVKAMSVTGCLVIMSQLCKLEAIKIMYAIKKHFQR